MRRARRVEWECFEKVNPDVIRSPLLHHCCCCCGHTHTHTHTHTNTHTLQLRDTHRAVHTHTRCSLETHIELCTHTHLCSLEGGRRRTKKQTDNFRSAIITTRTL